MMKINVIYGNDDLNNIFVRVLIREIYQIIGEEYEL